MRVLSVVNNKQNRHIPAAYKQGPTPLLLRASAAETSALRFLLTVTSPCPSGGFSFDPSDPVRLHKGGSGTKWRTMLVE